ncbi:DUF1850 domain-containing protein [Halobacillus sp. A1]|uniref:DUF1850 domain-containing protein n=1 Tax=Halobacillus sp. A1 TaxID=2880262 RepID=UPI0020A69A4F|nr:DUF1850 domain-containing protein [Halobacillus sp. A1]MCP3032436.1 DUF1850 domain-containing protein [Halobacillus sp. A1]
MKRRGVYTTIASLIIGVFIIGLIFYPYRSVVSFEKMDRQGPNIYLPLTEGKHFQVKYTHSVHLSDVIEEYEVKKERLYPIQLIYEDTGIGMPSGAGEGETFEMKDGKYYISNIQGYHDSISLSVGAVRADHTIRYENRSYLLKDYIGAGSVITIKPSHVSNWNLMRGETLSE